MSNRGENDFARMPGFATKMYANMTKAQPMQIHFREVAQYLVSHLDGGRVLDVGTGPGRLLVELYNLSPALELYGLDISAGMVAIAQKNLAGTGADLRVGNIRTSPYENDFFDLVTSTGSFYLWNNPRESLDEIYRIIKPGHSAVIFDSHKDFDPVHLKQLMRENLRGEGWIKRKLMPRLLLKQLGMTYTVEEVTEIVHQTQFAPNFRIEKVTLANLPIYQRIELTKG